MNKDQIEIERKYIIKKPSVDHMRDLPKFSESDITQIYIESAAGITHRVRRRASGDSVCYTETRKVRIDKMSAKETEREISENDFHRIAEKMEAGTRPITKTRYTFEYSGQLFEIDFYPEWERTAIMETELECRDAEVLMPDFLSIVREVTGNKLYSNASMSKSFPKEDQDFVE